MNNLHMLLWLTIPFAKINVPEVIRMELTAGLALANKARNAINKNKPHDALAFLLEAET